MESIIWMQGDRYWEALMKFSSGAAGSLVLMKCCHIYHGYPWRVDKSFEKSSHIDPTHQNVKDIVIV